jgi:hypothetical protein
VVVSAVEAGAGVTGRVPVAVRRAPVLARGGGAVTLTSGSCSTCGDAVCWAIAGRELRASSEGIRAVEASQQSRLVLRRSAVLEECMVRNRETSVARHREHSSPTRQNARLVQPLSVHPDQQARA